jgi:uroporphyrinogen III methyltransferase/synthase
MARKDPLRGRRIIVTRPRHQAASLKNALATLGADVVVAPAIRIEPPVDGAPLDAAVARADDYDWIVFTSVNGVEAFFDRATSTPRSELAAIGPATADALAERGVRASVVPERFVAEEVFEALSRHTDLSGKKILLPRADIAREALPNLLRDAGCDVDVVAAYRTTPASQDIERAIALVRDASVDAVTFTSGSTVRSFFSSADDTVRARVTPASIGPITSDALREENVEPVIEAERYTTEGLVEAIRRHFSPEVG